MINDESLHTISYISRARSTTWRLVRFDNGQETDQSESSAHTPKTRLDTAAFRFFEHQQSSRDDLPTLSFRRPLSDQLTKQSDDCADSCMSLSLLRTSGRVLLSHFEEARYSLANPSL